MRRPVVNTTFSPPRPAGYELHPASGNPSAAKMELLSLQEALLMLRNRVIEELDQMRPAERQRYAEWLQTMVSATAVADALPRLATSRSIPA